MTEKIAHQLIVKTLGDSDKLNIIKFIENLDLGKSKINSEKGNNVLIFKVKNKKGKYDINVLYPENGFINENDNSLMKIRNYVLSILGVNQVYSDFSNMPTRSLQDKLRKNVVYPYKNLDDIIRIFLRGNPNSQKDFYQRIWQYFSSSENFVDNYLAVWIFFINEKFTRDKNLELSFLLETKNKMFISDLRSRNDLLSKYVLYCYYRNKGDLELASEYKTFLLKNKVSDMLL